MSDLDSLVAALGGTHVKFPKPLLDHQEKLLRALGVTWEIDPKAPTLGTTHDPFNRGPDRHKKKGHRGRRA